jgi:hypothetical protein
MKNLKTVTNLLLLYQPQSQAQAIRLTLNIHHWWRKCIVIDTSATKITDLQALL